MGNYKITFRPFVYWRFCCMGLLLITLVSCASTGPVTDENISQMQGDFATRLNIVLDYISNGDRVFLVVDIDNPRLLYYDAWLVQKDTTAGQWASSGERFYQGKSKLEQRTFRLDVPKPGIIREIHIEVFDATGKPLMITEPIITNSLKGVTP